MTLKLDLHIDSTLENLEKVTKKFEEKGFSFDELKKYLKNKDFKKIVLLLGGGQISGSLSPFMHTYSATLLPEDLFEQLIH